MQFGLSDSTVEEEHNDAEFVEISNMLTMLEIYVTNDAISLI